MERRNIAAISIRLASPEKIRSWSNGEVKKPETINYRTFKPERDGLFCERIFGCVKDWECSCGSLRTIRYKGVRCERCGVEVTHSKIRRERMGHIELAAPVTHIWYLKGTPSRIALMLGVSVKELEQVVYFEKYIVIESKNENYPFKSLLTIEEYEEKRDEIEADVTVGMGAEGVKAVLERLDLNQIKNELTEAMEATRSKTKIKAYVKRLGLIKSFLDSGNRPEWMILDVIPVIPPDLRPMVQLDGGRFATSDLNDLYRRVINRNLRLKRLKELKAPRIIVRNEMRMLQESVDALMDNGRRGKKVVGTANRPLKSLTDMLKGKQGRFRQNLLGKRVDYSGRSVIVVGPEMELHQCGLPKKMALELFTPFVMRQLEARGIVNNIKSAKRLIEQESSEVWDALDEVIKDHPVLLNRAPTLHRLGIQAFQPTLVEGKAIKLHPLVCAAYNADFDGDQMAVHVPLSREAIMESFILMLSRNNVLSPANGRPIIGPTQDIVMGVYYITKDRPGAPGAGKKFSSRMEALRAYDEGVVSLHAPVTVRLDGKLLNTTVGRLIFNSILPEEFPYQNRTCGKAELGTILYNVFVQCGADAMAETADKMKNLGFKYATKAGISLGVVDMVIPSLKNELIRRGYDQVNKVVEQYRKGIISEGEKYDKLVNIWEHTTKEITRLMREEMEVSQGGFNPVHMMSNSGARGGIDQVRQLAGMRGLMADPSGRIKETPILSNFREGLTVYEFFLSTSGSRKGLTDTALKTANAGYLTRRLVDVAQDVIVLEQDCGTLRGLTLNIRQMKEDDGDGYVQDKIIGRVVLEDVVDMITGEAIAKAGDVIDEDVSLRIVQAGLEEIVVRSVLTCSTIRGVCAKCYGRDLSTGKIVELGEAVGIIAAQSIGEPGTQLTLRTFHVGGVASAEDNFIRAVFNGRISRVPDTRTQSDGSQPVVEEDYIYARRIGEIEISKDIIRFTTFRGRSYEETVGKNIKVDLLVNDGDEIDIDCPVIRLGYISPCNGSVIQFHMDTVLVKEGRESKAFKIPATFEKKIEIGDKLKKGDIIAERVFKTNFYGKVELKKSDSVKQITLVSQTEEPVSGTIQRGRAWESTLFVGAELKTKVGETVRKDQVIGENPNYKPIFSGKDGYIDFINTGLKKEHNEFTVNRPEEIRGGRDLDQGTALVWQGKELIVRGALEVEHGSHVEKGDKLGENVTAPLSGTVVVLRTYRVGNSDRMLNVVRIVEGFEKYPLPYLRYTGTSAASAKAGTKIKKSTIKLIARTILTIPKVFKDREKVFRDLFQKLENFSVKPVEDSSSTEGKGKKEGVLDLVPREFVVPRVSDLEEIDDIEQKVLSSLEEKSRISARELVAKQFSDFHRLGKKGGGSSRQRGITQDIVTGLPRVEELFEVRKPKTDPAIVTEIDGRVVMDDFGNTRVLKIYNEEADETREYKIGFEKQPIVQDGDELEAGDPLTDGPIDLHAMLKIQGEEAVQRYIVREIQEVYNKQGVFIHDKHIEVIVRQMMRKVKIVDPGDTSFLEAEEADIYAVRLENEGVLEQNGVPAKYEVQLRGITNVSKHSESFISAASFQETPWALTEAAIKGKSDHLFGLKENVIIGHLIPAGTGFRSYRNVEVDFEGRKEVLDKLERGRDEDEEKAESDVPEPTTA